MKFWASVWAVVTAELKIFLSFLFSLFGKLLYPKRVASTASCDVFGFLGYFCSVYYVLFFFFGLLVHILVDLLSH